MSFDDFLWGQHDYWDRERQEGPTDWGHADDGSEPRDPTPEEWAEIQAEFDLYAVTHAAEIEASQARGAESQDARTAPSRLRPLVECLEVLLPDSLHDGEGSDTTQRTECEEPNILHPAKGVAIRLV